MTIKVGGSFTCSQCGQWSDGADLHECTEYVRAPPPMTSDFILGLEAAAKVAQGHSATDCRGNDCGNVIADDIRALAAPPSTADHQHQWEDTPDGWQCKVCGVMSHTPKPPATTERSSPLASVSMSCGRFYLTVAGVVVAMEGDSCRDAELPESVLTPISPEELETATIGGEPAKDVPIELVRFFRGNRWNRQMLEYVAEKINAKRPAELGVVTPEQDQGEGGENTVAAQTAIPKDRSIE